MTPTRTPTPTAALYALAETVPTASGGLTRLNAWRTLAANLRHGWNADRVPGVAGLCLTVFLRNLDDLISYIEAAGPERAGLLRADAAHLCATFYADLAELRPFDPELYDALGTLLRELAK